MIGFPNHHFSGQQSTLKSPQVDSSLLLVSNKKLENINCIFKPTGTLGGLYLGDIISTIKEEHLKNNNIRAILSCMWEKVTINPSINCHKVLPIKDLLEYPIIQHFDQAVAWIAQKRKEKKNVLVHCHAGVSRSATIVIAYLIRTQNWNPFQAFEFVRQQRERIKPNVSFWNQINDYYNYWSKQNVPVLAHTKKGREISGHPHSIIHKVVSQQLLPSKAGSVLNPQLEEKPKTLKTQAKQIPQQRNQKQVQKVSVRRRRKIFEKLTFENDEGDVAKKEQISSLHYTSPHKRQNNRLNPSLIQQNSSIIDKNPFVVNSHKSELYLLNKK